MRLTKEDLRPLSLPGNWQPAARMGARNSTFFEAESVVSQPDDLEFAKDNLWTGGQQLVWHPTEAERQLNFLLPVKESGKYVIRITGAMMPQSGRISAVLAGEPLPLATDDGTFDMKTEFRTMSRTVSSHELQLDQGQVQLGIRAEGPLDSEPIIGIDFIWLQRR
jgi:hypothetical protein